MANMGAQRLILIEPQCKITFKAHQSAASGQTALENRTVYTNWTDFLQREPDGIRISFTARDGKSRQVRDFQQTLTWLRAEHPELQDPAAPPLNLFLIFGPEDWGLSGEDLELTHFSCNIPTFGDNTSLNLGQAVLLALYSLRLSWGGNKTKLEGQQPERIRDRESVFPEQALHTWLSEMGFNLENRKMNTYNVLKRMLLQNVPNSKELRVLEIVLQQSIRKLREYNTLRKSAGLPAIEGQSGDDGEV